MLQPRFDGEPELICVAPHLIQAIWPHVAAFIENALKRSGSDFTVDRIKRKIDAGESYLWIMWDGGLLGAGTTELAALEDGRKLCIITTCAGKDMAKWQHLVAHIESYARAEGCAAVRVYGRSGWARQLKPQGYRQPYIVLEKGL